MQIFKQRDNRGQLFTGINNELYYSHFTDDNNGYASSFNSVIKTTDGGANWIKLTSISFGGPVYFRNANTGYQAATNWGCFTKPPMAVQVSHLLSPVTLHLSEAYISPGIIQVTWLPQTRRF